MSEQPPETPREPVIDELHGDRYEDPYRWLEENDERVAEWVDAQNEYADAHLDGDTREYLRPRFEDLAAVTEYGTVVPRGDRRFGRVEAPDEDHAVLYTWTATAPDEPAAYDYISDYSPYQHVEARTYPPVLFETAAGDTRVHPSHARKMTARMQHRSNGGPVLLRTNNDTGHSVGKPTSMVVEEQLDTWTFLYRTLDVESN